MRTDCMPSRCEVWCSIRARGCLDRGLNVKRETSNRLIWAGVCATLLCLSALSQPVFSADSETRKSGSVQNKVQVCDNASYDGASLPAPAKKKNQVVVGGDEGADGSVQRKNRHKKQVEIDTASDSMSSNGSSSDSSGGASLPPPKKVTRPQSDAGKVANDKDKEARFGHGGDRRGNREAGGVFGKGPLDLTALNLTDEQKQKIAQMHGDNGAKMRDLMRKRRDLTTQMRDLMFDPDVNETQIRAKRDEVRQVQEKLEDLRLNDFLSIRSLLTAEQRQKLKDVKIANRPHDDGSPSPPALAQPAKRAELDKSDKSDKNDQKRLADTQNK